MTGAAVFGNNILAVCHHQRHVGLMAAPAAVASHGIGMGQMTVLAGLDLAMEGVAGRTGQFAVNARVGQQLFTLFCMACQTGRGYIPAEADLQRLMRVTMTCDAAGQCKMRTVPMAAAAGRDDLHVSRRMPLMAIHAERPVGLALALQGKDNAVMALDAIPSADSSLNNGIVLALGRHWP